MPNEYLSQGVRNFLAIFFFIVVQIFVISIFPIPKHPQFYLSGAGLSYSSVFAHLIALMGAGYFLLKPLGKKITAITLICYLSLFTIMSVISYQRNVDAENRIDAQLDETNRQICNVTPDSPWCRK